MAESPLYYFTDAVLRGPTLGTMLMCLSAALVGVVVFLRKQSLIGEALSHAAYPGVILGVIAASFWAPDWNEDAAFAALILGGAFASGLLGLWLISALEKYLKVRSDSALCFVLSGFFGIGITCASRIQFTHTALYTQAQVYLYGQAATMSDLHVIIYAILAIAVIAMLLLLYKELQVMLFDKNFAKSLGVQTSLIDATLFALIAAAVVIGIRSVGVVLMSAMLIAPAAAARQYTNKLYGMLLLAGFFGLVSGFTGNYLAIELTKYLAGQYPAARLSLPTGPMIVLVASAICVGSLLFAPERGLLLRLIRIAFFRYKCLCENLLKTIWRLSFTSDAEGKQNSAVTFDELIKYQNIHYFYTRFIVRRLIKNGWLIRLSPTSYSLSFDGYKQASRIVRLHRLWEVYLANYLGVGAERVHCNADEMEHILTPELERELTKILKDPKQDPHHQPIPPKAAL